jgi:hypothetical protein
MRGATKATRYAYGDTRAGQRNPAVLKRGGPPATIGHHRFFGPGGAKKAWRDFCAERELAQERAAIQEFGGG